MIVRVSTATLFLAAAIGLSSTASARDLTVVAWGGPVQRAQDTAQFKPFVETTKIPLKQVSWEGGIGIIRAKVQSGQADWDVVQVESDELAIGCEENLYEKLDFTKIGGKDIYVPDSVSPCGVGSLVYNFVLGYNPAGLPSEPTGWVDFFDLKKFPGKRGLRSGAKLTLEIALLGDGVPPKDVYKVLGTEEGVARAFKKLDTIKPMIIWWQTGQKPVELLNANEVVMTGIYNGRITAANKTGKNYKMIWKDSMFTWDSWVILKGSPNKEAAYKLLDFMGDAERQAQQLGLMANGTSNKKAVSLVSNEVAAELPSNPKNHAGSFEVNANFWLDNLDKLTERYTKWAAQ